MSGRETILEVEFICSIFLDFSELNRVLSCSNTCQLLICIFCFTVWDIYILNKLRNAKDKWHMFRILLTIAKHVEQMTLARVLHAALSLFQLLHYFFILSLSAILENSFITYGAVACIQYKYLVFHP